MKEIKHVKIVRCSEDSYWYKDLIGFVFNVVDSSVRGDYRVLKVSGKENKHGIDKADCVEISTKPGTLKNGKRWFSICDKDLPEVRALIGKEVYVASAHFEKPKKLTLIMISAWFETKGRYWHFIAIPEKSSPRIPDANTPRGTRVRCRDDDCIDDEWLNISYPFYLYDKTLKYPFMVISADGEVLSWKHAEIIEGGEDED